MNAGLLGEYWTLFRLAEMGLAASPAAPGARLVDIVVYDVGKDVLATIQVKARSTRNRDGWCVNAGRRMLVSKTHYYVFVDLIYLYDHRPKSYVVPSIEVSGIIRREVKGDLDVKHFCRHLVRHSNTQKPIDLIHILPSLKPIRGPRGKSPPGDYLEAWWLIHSKLPFLYAQDNDGITSS